MQWHNEPVIVDTRTNVFDAPDPAQIEGPHFTARGDDGSHLHIEAAPFGSAFAIELVMPNGEIRQRVLSDVTIDRAKAEAEAMVAAA